MLARPLFVFPSGVSTTTDGSSAAGVAAATGSAAPAATSATVSAGTSPAGSSGSTQWKFCYFFCSFLIIPMHRTFSTLIEEDFSLIYRTFIHQYSSISAVAQTRTVDFIRFLLGESIGETFVHTWGKLLYTVRGNFCTHLGKVLYTVEF